MQQAEAPASTLVAPAFELLTQTPTLATYRLTYAIDVCEHVQPNPSPPMIPWQLDLCGHSEPTSKPRVLRYAELRLSVQTRVEVAITEGPSYLVFALGAADIASLDSAHVLSGVAIVAKETP